MPKFSVVKCRKTYDEDNQDCGGICYTDTCPLIPQPVKPTELNAVILDVYFKKEQVGWQGIEYMGLDYSFTADEIEYMYTALGKLSAYYGIKQLPEEEQSKAMTELLDG